MPTVLVELPGGEGMIRRDDGELVLSHDVTLDRGQPLQPWDKYKPIRIALSEDRMLFGGQLPPGAVSAEAVEATGMRKPVAVGDGTYAVIFEDGEHGEPVLGYRDEAGTFVHRPMPAEYPHRPVADADEPCPMCGAVQFEEYFPTEDWRAGQGQKGTSSYQPSPLIVCRLCGHQEQGGGILRLRPVEEPGPDEAARAVRMARIREEQRVQRRLSDKITLMAVTFPIYAAEGWPARINGSGSRGDALTHLRIAHVETLPDDIVIQRARIAITTSIDPFQQGEWELARHVLASQVEADASRPTDGLSDAALTLRFRASRRRRAASSVEAPVSEREIVIDGTPEPFVVVGAFTGHWVAVRHHRDVTITITARQIDPASLVIEPVVDLNARFLGPEPEQP